MDLGVSSIFQAWTSPSPAAANANITPTPAARRYSNASSAGASTGPSDRKFASELSDVDSFFDTISKSASPRAAASQTSQSSYVEPSILGLGSAFLGAIGGALETVVGSSSADPPAQSADQQQPQPQAQHVRMQTISDSYNDEDSDFSVETLSTSSETGFEYNSDSTGNRTPRSGSRRFKSPLAKKKSPRGKSEEGRSKAVSFSTDASANFTRVIDAEDLGDSVISASRSRSSECDSAFPQTTVEMLVGTVLLPGAVPSAACMESIYKLMRASSGSQQTRLVPVKVTAADADIGRLYDLSTNGPEYPDTDSMTLMRPNGRSDSVISIQSSRQSTATTPESISGKSTSTMATSSASPSRAPTTPLAATSDLRRGSDSPVFDELNEREVTNQSTRRERRQPYQAPNNLFISDSEDDLVMESRTAIKPRSPEISKSAGSDRQGGNGLDLLRSKLQRLEQTNKKLNEEIEFLVSSPSSPRGSSADDFRRSDVDDEMLGFAVRFRCMNPTDANRSRISVMCIYPDVGTRHAAPPSQSPQSFTVSLNSVRSCIANTTGELEYWYDIAMDPVQFSGLKSDDRLIVEVIAFRCSRSRTFSLTCVSSQACVYCIKAMNALIRQSLLTLEVAGTASPVKVIPQYFVGSPINPAKQRTANHVASGENDLLRHFSEVSVARQMEHGIKYSLDTSPRAKSPASRSSPMRLTFAIDSVSSAERALTSFSDDDEAEEDREWENLQTALAQTRRELNRKLSNISNPDSQLS
jgi:hypothetical protein